MLTSALRILYKTGSHIANSALQRSRAATTSPISRGRFVGRTTPAEVAQQAVNLDYVAARFYVPNHCKPAKLSAQPSKFELVHAHADAPPAESHPLILEAQALFESRSSAQFYFASCAHYSVPGNRAVRRSQRPCHLPRITWITGGTRH